MLALSDKQYLLLGALAGLSRAARKRGLKLKGREVVLLLGGDLLRTIVSHLLRRRRSLMPDA